MPYLGTPRPSRPARAIRGRRSAMLATLPFLLMPIGSRAADVPPGAMVLDAPAIVKDHPAQANYETVTRAGTRLVAGGEHGLVVLSDDNGNSWRQAKVPVSSTILEIRFATPQVGWAVGAFGTVLHTADGGETWTLQLDGIRATDIMVATAKALPPPPPPAPGAAPAAAAAPADPSTPPGADSGPAVPQRLRRALSFKSDGPDKPFFVLDVADADHVRVIGAYDMAFESADGGKTWTEWDQRIDDVGDLHPYAIAGSGAGTVLVGERGLLLHGDPAVEMKALANPPYDGSYFGVVDGGKSGMFAFGLLGHLYRSTDGANSWTQLKDPSTATLSCGLAMANGRIVFADLGGTIWRLDGDAITPSAAKRPWPITSMVEAADGSIVAAGLGGVSRIDAKLIDEQPSAGG